jgi:hypothetical protein
MLSERIINRAKRVVVVVRVQTKRQFAGRVQVSIVVSVSFALRDERRNAEMTVEKAGERHGTYSSYRFGPRNLPACMSCFVTKNVLPVPDASEKFVCPTHPDSIGKARK